MCVFSSRLCMGAAVAAAVVLAPAADAATRFVAPCGQDFWTGVDVNCAAPNGPKRTIQAAINASSAGDTILVLPGVYVETIDFDGKELTIEGLAGPATTIIDGNGDGPVVLCNSFEGPGTTLRGFTIRNGYNEDTNGAGMVVALATVTVDDCIFEDNETGPPTAGAGIASLSGILTVTDCQFLNNIGWSAGGILVWGGNATVANCTFDGNSGGNRGGGMYIYQAVAEITDCEFINGYVGAIDAAGAGLYIDDATVTMDGCTISDNLPFRGTAGIHVVGSELSLNDCDFENNHADSPQAYGNAIYADESSVSATACDFINNTGGDLGGAIYSMSSAIEMIGCQFSDNQSNGVGGAIYGGDTDITATFCGFLNNHAEGDGGAIAVSGLSSITASLCTFAGNSSDQWRGGAIAAAYQAPLVLTSCNFSNNTIGPFGKGGAVFQMGGSMLASGCIFNGNSAPEGGAVNVQDLDGEAQFVDCTFEDNEAYDGNGGAIRAAEETPVAVTGGSFDVNDSTSIGGAIYFEGINAGLVLSEVVFNANHADTAAGAVSTVAPTLIVDCTFVGNSSLDAGALAIGTAFGDTRIYNSRFAANSATQVGSAIMAGAFSSGPSVDIINCIIDNNSCPFGGGAIHESALGANVRIFNSSIVNNIGGGYKVVNGASNSEVANSIVWGNTQGGGIAGNLPLVHFSNVQGGVMGPTSISVNPQFVDAGAGDYRLTAKSPCIDAGHNWLLPHDLNDLDSDGDDMEFVPFDFAGNPRVMDDPSKAASPCSNSPSTVDMGPYETEGDALEPARLGDLVSSATFQPPADGVVNSADLSVLLGAWGPCEDGCCPADLDLSGEVDAWDLALLLGSWG